MDQHPLFFYTFIETFPNATNPMKIIPSPSLPNLKVQRLNVLNKLSSMKGSCIAINSNDATEQNAAAAAAEPSSSEHLERRTIDSKHISTVSSLVATKSEDDVCKSSKAKESQRNNFGLYALKFHRNLSTHANSMIQSFKKDIGKRSKSSAKTVNETNISESPEFNAARANRSKHEQFEPCHQQIHYHRADEHHYDSEFDDTYTVNVFDDSNRFQRNNRSKHESESDVNGPNARAPVRPRRIKPTAPKANSRAGHNLEATKTTFQSIDLPYSSYDDTTHSVDNFGSDDHNVMNI